VNERTHLDLFSGIGGFALAAKWNGFRTVGFCDNEPYAQAVLKKHWPDVPVHGDIREVRGDLYAGVTLLTGGFPCQPFSVAGKQRGKGDDRYLWPEMLRVIREARPAWIVGENVAGIVNMALDQVHTDLEAEGYEVESLIVPACAVDAPHRRDRVWIVGHAKFNGLASTKKCRGLLNQSKESGGQIEKRKPSGAGGASSDVADAVSLPTGGAHGEDQRKCERGRKEQGICQRDQVGSDPANSGEDVADAMGVGIQGHGTSRIEKPQAHGCEGLSLREGEGPGATEWMPEPRLGRVANGVPNRTHRIKGLGNAIVPQVAAKIIRCIAQLEDTQ
jgi:DNA (cytosine-5)-methyltransferase 1